MKLNDHKMLEEAYNQVNENLYGKPEAKFIEMEDGRQMRDLEELDKQALFAYVMDRPQLRKELDYLVKAGSMPQISKWIESLEKSQNVISNGLQKSYLFNVCQEEIFAKDPRAKEEHEALRKKLDGPLSGHPSANNKPKPTISSLANQDTREVQGYSRTYGEAHEIPPMRGGGEPWWKDDKKKNISQIIDDTLEKFAPDLNYIKFAEALAVILNKRYFTQGPKGLKPIQFLSALDNAIKNNKQDL